MNKLFFVLPVFNEEKNIIKLLESIKNINRIEDWETNIVAINDGSTDNSLKLLEYARTEYRLQIISYHPNKGIPSVFTHAFQYLYNILNDEDIVIIMESDGTSDLSLIPDFVNAIKNGSDIVIASRNIKGGAYLNFPLQRKLGSSMVNLFLQIIWRVPNVKDYTIFYRAYKGKILKKYIHNGINFQAKKSFAANGELLLRISKFNPIIKEIPLQYDYGLKKGKSKMKLFNTLWEYLKIKK